MEKKYLPVGLPFMNVLIRTDRCHIVLKALDIIALQVFNKYVHIYTFSSDKPRIVLGTLCAMEEKLFPLYFCRTHPSCIVGLHHIVSIQKDTVLLLRDIEIPLHKQHRGELLGRFCQLN